MTLLSNRDLKRVEEGLSEKLGLAIYHASTAVIAIATAFCHGWKLTLIIVSLLPFLAFGTSVMNKAKEKPIVKALLIIFYS